MNWITEVGELLPNAYEPKNIPQVGELDELETFIGSKKNPIRGQAKFGCGQP